MAIRSESKDFIKFFLNEPEADRFGFSFRLLGSEAENVI